MIFNSQIIWLLRYHVYFPQRLSSSAWCSPDLFTEYIGYSLSGFFVEPLHPPQLPSGLFYSSSKFSILYTLNLYLWYSILLWNTESLCVCVCKLNQVQFFGTLFIPPGCSVHGIVQARTLKWVVISYSRGSSRPRDQTSIWTISNSLPPLGILGRTPIFLPIHIVELSLQSKWHFLPFFQLPKSKI